MANPDNSNQLHKLRQQLKKIGPTRFLLLLDPNGDVQALTKEQKDAYPTSKDFLLAIHDAL